MNSNLKQPSLFSAIAIGVGCIIGSGWLFAAYYASRYAGTISLLSWVIGAILSLMLALLLAEVATIFPQERGLFSRLISLSHNRDYGFVVAISNWLGLVITIPSEATATIQYLSTSIPNLESFFFHNHHLTALGIVAACVLMFIYATLNYWGIKTLTKANNLITIFKLIIPTVTALLLITTSFHSENFTAYHDSIAPYGIHRAFTAVVVSGIFYAFYGFGMISVYGAELRNPARNIPIALVCSVLICLILYLFLQTAFIGSLPTDMIKQGWHQINFTSPLAELLILLNINFWAVVLYIDAAISPSGTAILYTGSASRMLTGMAHDHQAPQYFSELHPVHGFSRRSLGFTILFCLIMITFFRNWQKIMIVVTVFQLITCLAIPICFTKLRQTLPDDRRKFKLCFGNLIGILIFLLLSFLLTQAGITALLLSLVMHTILFLIYSFSYYRKDIFKIINAIRSSWTIFAYLAFTTLFGYFNDIGILMRPWIIILFFLLSLISYWLLIKQKDAHEVS